MTFAAAGHDKTPLRLSEGRLVVSEVPNWNHLRRLDRLDSAWIQGSPAFQASARLAFDEGFDALVDVVGPR